jgi:membrane associated rhomboid family serine protease
MSDRKTAEVIKAILFPLGFTIFLWLIHIMKETIGWPNGSLGLYPRNLKGLQGIMFAPILHGDWTHLLKNSITLIVSSLMLFVFYKRVALKSFTFIYILTGVLVWIFGRQVFHIGASGVVYGLISFIFWTGLFRRNIKSIILALIILFMYSPMFEGILPNQPGISWESHLLGAIAGIFVAWVFKNEIELDEEPVVYQLEESGTEYFFDQDVFEKTRAEKQQDQEF